MGSFGEWLSWAVIRKTHEWAALGSDVHFIFSPGKFQAPYFMCALANFTEIS